MYLGFYGLKEQPFGTTPDPRFLYLTPAHQEALAQLLQGVREDKGFLVLTGEAGTGKTTLLRALHQRLDETTVVASGVSSTLPVDGLIEHILEAFRIAEAGESAAQRRSALDHFLVERRRAGQNTLLIIDEAQRLGASALEQMESLSNFETLAEMLPGPVVLPSVRRQDTG